MGTIRKPRIKGGKYEYRFKDEFGKIKQKSLSTDKSISRAIAAKIDKDIAKREAGIIDDYLEQTRLPIGKHLSDFQSDLGSTGNSEAHILDTINCCQKIIKGCGFKRITDLTEFKVRQWLKTQRESRNDFSSRTSNRHLTAIKMFANWLFKSHRTQDHRLAGLKKLNEETDRQRIRRALSNDDFAKLLQTTKESPRIDQGSNWRFDGLSRYALYVIASLTGLRASELESMKVHDFNRFRKSIKVEARNTKNHEIAVLPLHPEACQVLADHIQRNNLKNDDQLWKGTWATKQRKQAALLKRDLKEAKIAYQDDQGKVFDFHSLRVQFGTSLARADVSLKKAQELMRHSTPLLTARVYQQLTTTDLTESIGRLSIPTLAIETQQAAS